MRQANCLSACWEAAQTLCCVRCLVEALAAVPGRLVLDVGASVFPKSQKEVSLKVMFLSLLCWRVGASRHVSFTGAYMRLSA